MRVGNITKFFVRVQSWIRYLYEIRKNKLSVPERIPKFAVLCIRTYRNLCIQNSWHKKMSAFNEVLRRFLGNVGERFLRILEILLYFAMDGLLSCFVGYGIFWIDSFLTQAALDFGVTPKYSRWLLLIIEAPIAYHVFIFVWRDFKKCLHEGRDDHTKG